MMKNLVELLQKNVQENPEFTFFRLLEKEGVSEITYGDFYKMVLKAAAGMRDAGVQAHDRVVLCSENRFEWFIGLEATFILGAVAAPLYATASAGQQQFVVDDCSASFGFFSKMSQYKKVEKFAEDNFKKSIIFDLEKSEGKIVSLDDFLAGEYAPLESDISPSGSDDTAILIYTSGTTGEPKGVMLTHKNILANVEMIIPIVEEIEQFDYISLLPLSHSYEFAVLQLVIQQKGTIAPVKSMGKVLEYIQGVEPSVSCAVPRLFEKIYNSVTGKVAQGSPLIAKMFNDGIAIGTKYYREIESGKSIPLIPRLKLAFYNHLIFKKIREKTVGSVELFISGGAALQPEIARFFNILGTTILEGYGITECSPVVSCNLPHNKEVGTVGLPLIGVEVKLTAEKELLVRGDLVMKGYYNRPEDTKEAIDEDGWFHTGDIADILPDGKIKILGRIKEIIVLASGKNIAPAKMENKIKASRYVDNICVVGDEQKYLGALIIPEVSELKIFAKEQGIAYKNEDELLKDSAVLLLFKQLISEANKTFEPYEVVKEFKLLSIPCSVENGELTPTMKVRRRIVAERYKDIIDSLF